MPIDIYEGSRRLGRVFAILVSIAIGVSIFFSQDQLTQYISVKEPKIAPTSVNSCTLADYPRWIGEVSSNFGLSFQRTLCFQQLKFDTGEYVGIPISYSADGNFYELALPSSSAGTRYMSDYETSDFVTKMPPPPTKLLLINFSKHIGWALAGASATYAILLSIFAVIGWITRGFIKPTA